MAFLAALQFLTIAPPLVKRNFSPAEWGRAVAWFPSVGLLLGSVLWGLNEAVRLLWPPSVAAALVLAAWVLATGALHLDGFLDCCDGLFGGKTPADRLRIMRDERVGAFAVAGGVLLLLAKYAALADMPFRRDGLLLAPALGRWAMTAALVLFPYARSDGLGRSLKDNAGWRALIIATLIAGVAAWFIGRERGLIALVAAALAAGIAVGFTMRRLFGLTGDVYGAICEGVELVVLLVFTAELRT